MGTGHGAPEAGLCTLMVDGAHWRCWCWSCSPCPSRRSIRACGAPVHPRLVREPVAAKHGAGHRPGPGRTIWLATYGGLVRYSGDGFAALERSRARAMRNTPSPHWRRTATAACGSARSTAACTVAAAVVSKRSSAGPAGERVRPDAGSRRRPVAGHECRHRPPPARQRWRDRTHRGRTTGTLPRPGQRSGRRQRVDRRRRHGRGALARRRGRAVRHGARPASSAVYSLATDSAATWLAPAGLVRYAGGGFRRDPRTAASTPRASTPCTATATATCGWLRRMSRCAA